MFPWSETAEPLRFDQFMAAALHDPVHGYYGRRIRTVGPKGDFSTTATLSAVLARAISHWAAKALSSSRCRDLIELGPGSGELAAAVMDQLPWHVRLRTRLHLVESSVPLQTVQQSRLGKRAKWHRRATDALDSCGGNACIFSNEFLDAFPVRRFRLRNQRWEESHLLPNEERWIPAGTLPESSVFSRKFADGQVVEVGEAVRNWLRETLPHWRSGRMLHIDYGAEAPDLYHRQPHGSLRAYFHHQCLTGVEAFARPGHQDLTADVNFTDLRQASASHSRHLSLQPQREFLQPFVKPNEASDSHAAVAGGAGDAFLVWESEAGS